MTITTTINLTKIMTSCPSPSSRDNDHALQHDQDRDGDHNHHREFGRDLDHDYNFDRFRDNSSNDISYNDTSSTTIRITTFRLLVYLYPLRLINRGRFLSLIH